MENDQLPDITGGDPAMAEALAAIETKPQTPVEVAIDAWFVDCIHNSPVSRQTEIFNHCMAAKEELKRRIAAL